MIENRSVLAVVPARGGSKGLPRKNILPLGGLPLIAHSIQHALGSAYVDACICSTEDEEIAAVARAHGCDVPFLRPAELATDETRGPAVVHDLCRKIARYDYVVILQPTSPLRLPEDIDRSIELCHRDEAPSVTTVCEVDKNPHWMYHIADNASMEPVIAHQELETRRQDLPTAHVLNGAVYVLRWEDICAGKPWIMPETLAHVMPKDRSVDIDTALDLEFVNLLYRNR